MVSQYYVVTQLDQLQKALLEPAAVSFGLQWINRLLNPISGTVLIQYLFFRFFGGEAVNVQIHCGGCRVVGGGSG